MRILHVNKYLYRRGGAESYMLDVAEMQRQRGDDVHFFSMQHESNEPAEHADLFPPLMELSPPADTLGGRLRTAAEVVWRPSARAGMTAVLDRVRPDVVHLHNIYHQLSPSVLSPLKGRDLRSVMTLHDYKLVCPTYQMLDDGKICEACLPGGRFREATKRRCNRGSLAGSLLSTVETRIHRTLDLYGEIDTLICPSRFLEAKMVEGGIPADRLRHLPHFTEIAGAAATEPGRGAFFAGRLSPEKGVDVLVRAAALLDADQTVTIAGDGPEAETLRALAASQTGGARVEFLGRIPKDEVERRMRGAAVVVVPSRWYENQPMTILEAFGAGRPVVASALGGMPELISDATGALVPHDDPAALAEALRPLLADPTAAHELGRAARAYAEDGFTPDAHLAGLDALYLGATA